MPELHPHARPENHHKYHNLITADQHSWQMALQVIRLVLIGWQQVDHAVDKVNATSTAASVCEKRSVKRPTFFSACLLTFFFHLAHCPVSSFRICPVTRGAETPLPFPWRSSSCLTPSTAGGDLCNQSKMSNTQEGEEKKKREKKWKHFEAEVLILPCIQTSGKSVRACLSSDIKGQWVTSGNRRRADTRERMNHWWQIKCPFFFWSFFFVHEWYVAQYPVPRL